MLDGMVTLFKKIDNSNEHQSCFYSVCSCGEGVYRIKNLQQKMLAAAGSLTWIIEKVEKRRKQERIYAMKRV